MLRPISGGGGGGSMSTSMERWARAIVGVCSFAPCGNKSDRMGTSEIHSVHVRSASIAL